VSPRPTRKLRCAVYTRKSSEEGLEQEFNSLHAQREAGIAYIASQKSEGWIALADYYDDGGISGGTLERPALQRLLRDIEAGMVDVVVVYKIDRLSRSLTDFAKLVDLFERRNVTFVSVTQQFNTTTSMGRLTLNILLSFAQFEREVIGERIRDKFAASRKKGIWMGGWPALGYEVQDRRLVVVEREAALVRRIVDRFAKTGSALAVARELNAAGEVTKHRASANGARGGRQWTKGAIYKVLANRVYLGEAVHKGVAYPGEHAAIVDRRTWDNAHAVMAEPAHRRGAATRAQVPALLKGLIYGPNGRPMSPSHTRRRGRIYRYYVTREAIADGYESCLVTSVPAADVEGAVLEHVQRLLAAPELVARTWASARRDGEDEITERDVTVLLADFATVWSELFPAEQSRIVQLLIARVNVHEDALEVRIRAEGLMSLVGELRQQSDRKAPDERRRDHARWHDARRAHPHAVPAPRWPQADRDARWERDCEDREVAAGRHASQNAGAGVAVATDAGK
jgi:site-specific DNA recombinase